VDLSQKIKPQDLIKKLIPSRKKKWALVLEGGAMRCIFTSGVLDAIHETARHRFDFMLSVSAGSGCGISFLADQKGRSQKIFINYLSTNEFIDFRRFLKGRHIMDLGYAIREINQNLMPVNMEKFSASRTKFYTVLTCAETGDAVYVKPSESELMDSLIASCNLPYLTTAPAVFKEGRYVDGGVANPIPIQEAIDMGAEKIVAVLTRPRGYRKTSSAFFSQIMGSFFSEFGNLHDLIKNDYLNYNRDKVFVEDFKSDKVELITVEPPADFPVDRLTTRRETLLQGYAMGLIEGLKLSEKLSEFE
jgi:predicted patatin/cPLA2 family phospholipase